MTQQSFFYYCRISNKFKSNSLDQDKPNNQNQPSHKISQTNCSIRQFDRDIAEQFWEHSSKTAEGKVLLKNYIQTIIDAKNILTENIEKCKKHLSILLIKNKIQLQECVISYSQDLEIINKTFKFTEISLGNSNFSTPVSGSAQKQSHVSSRIFSYDISNQQESLSLRFAFYLVVFLILLELFCMFVRHHFINLLAYMAILAIYFLKYFDSTYMKTVLVAILIATISDIFWFILQSGHFWTPSAQTIYSHLRDGIIRLIVLIVVCSIIGKALLFVLLFRFRENLSTTKKMVNMCGNKVQLIGSSETNPLTHLIKKDRDLY